MAKATQQILAPSGIYNRKPKPALKAWVNSENSRFSATQEADKMPWQITHRRSGAAITSACGILRTRKEALDIIATFEACGFDFSPFDRLPEVSLESTVCPDFPEEDLPLVRPMVDVLRQIAWGKYSQPLAA